MARRSKTKTATPIAALNGSTMIIGIAILLLVDAIDFWPWILVVLALASMPAGMQRTRSAAGALPALLIPRRVHLHRRDQRWLHRNEAERRFEGGRVAG